MRHFINCIIIFILCFFYFGLNKNADIFSVSAIVGMLLAFITLAYSYFLQSRHFTFTISIIYGICIIFSPELIAFLPIIIYCLYSFKNNIMNISFSIFILSYMTFLYNKTIATQQTSCIIYIFYIIILCALSVYISHTTKSHELLIEKSRRYRDDSTEITLLLKEKNKGLLTNQDYEINNATLMERNRIAREIHDNVGHLLSRAIMITGAIKVINKNEALCQSIDNLEECLSQAMNNIRDSVHNLHNNSISLENTVKNLTDNFKFCDIKLVYDIMDDVPNDIKYAFISIVKEGLTNIERHSNATKVKLTIREHPAMYQLILNDNGTSSSDFDSSVYESESYISGSAGIGLNNIYSRIQALKGTIKIYTDNGFCIFISIPKNN